MGRGTGNVGRLFIAGLWAFGLLSGLVAARSPALRETVIPSLAWPLIAALVVDLALMPFVQRGRVRALTMDERIVAVIGSALIHSGLLAWLAP
jgi:hypothetical protein